MEIKWKDGTRHKTNVEDAYAELERIRKLTGGDLELQVLVNESKPKDAVLHPEFEWSNAKAANHWRLHEARLLTRHIITVEDEDAGTPEHRHYESVRIVETSPEDEKPVVRYAFRRTEDIMADPNTRDELLGQAIRDALALKKRYSGLQELAKVFAALDEVLMEIRA
jgi:hypothetical protein